MTSIPKYRKIYLLIIDALTSASLARGELLDAVIAGYPLTDEEREDKSTNGTLNVLRSRAGTVIGEMQKRGMISLGEDARYYKVAEKAIAIRIEEIEEALLGMLASRPMTKSEIKDTLVSTFKTDTTPTDKDDNKLFTYLGQLLKGLVAEKILSFDGAVYSIAPTRSAEIKNRREVAALKADFLSLVHSKGGEFFEHYFMNLLSRYLIRTGKTVTESKTTGGATDGGIDGIASTVDSLGFREVIMVQMKNRIDETVETEVRSFYGAVCARQGSRGIFATTSDFHPMARKFLDGIDNCVGVNGDKVFSMAIDTSYGIKREGESLVIDREVIY